jgi:7-cyano-7-deazaguanine synthase
MSRRALVLFSGGQDSTVCLAWALAQFDDVETIGFDYGQRHRIELQCRAIVREKLIAQFPEWKPKLRQDHLLDLPGLGKISDTALTRDAEIAYQKNGLPNTFVPGRNLLFFTYAAAAGYRREIKNLVGGMCETDYSGYPDCRDATLQALQHAINLGTGENFVIHTPLMKLTKAATWQLAHELGGDALIALIRDDTHTCYRGERGSRHEWGFGCGECPACKLRADGWRDWRKNRRAA